MVLNAYERLIDIAPKNFCFEYNSLLGIRVNQLLIVLSDCERFVNVASEICILVLFYYLSKVI